MYSSMLTRLFVNMGVPFPVGLRASAAPPAGSILRVTPIYTQLEHSRTVVARCPNHAALSTDPTAPSQHVVRCDNPSALYETDPVSVRHSLFASRPASCSSPLCVLCCRAPSHLFRVTVTCAAAILVARPLRRSRSSRGAASRDAPAHVLLLLSGWSQPPHRRPQLHARARVRPGPLCASCSSS